MLLKLLNLGIRGNFYIVVKNMYSKVQSSIKINSKRTEFFKCNIGVKQGESLSPNLFNLYTHDLPDIFCMDNAPMLSDEKISCLMFADDLVIFSLKPGELQENLNRLKVYCDKWKLKINLQKTKIIEFCPSGKICNIKFYLNDFILENVNNYKYLGIDLKSSGSFEMAAQSLSNKAMKVSFTLKKTLQNTTASPNLGLQLFDQLVKPILTYNAEIWAMNKFKNQQNDCFLKEMHKFKGEKVNMNFCRYLLGVNCKSSIIATLGELGRFLMLLEIWYMAFKYIEHVTSDVKEDLLAHKAFLMQQSLKYSGSWWNALQNISNLLKINDIRNIKLIKKVIHSKFINQWKNKLMNDKKLETYKKFKSNFLYEKYLNDVTNVVDRKNLTRLRISAHHLMIEKGRHLNIPSNERF